MTFQPPTGRRKARILIVDDHPLIRSGVVELVGRQPDMEVCGEAERGREGIGAARTLHPDIIVVDLTLGDMDGLDLIRSIRKEHARVGILVLSNSEETIYAERALRAGANGYVMKHEHLQVVLGALRRVLKGEVFLSERMQSRIMQHLARRMRPEDDSPIPSMTDRELQVLEMIGKGMGPSQIAKQLCVSVKTIGSHCARIKAKFGLKTAAELRLCAVEWCRNEGKT
jgi:DNA-binding NarL/FixJ family response regulator